MYRVGSYQACPACGSTRVVRKTVPAEDGVRERVIIVCDGCGRQRATYLRKKKQAA